MKIKDVKFEHIGRGVVYRSAPDFKPEQGIITSFNEKNIFVSFGARTMGRGEACNPGDLEWLSNNG